MLWNKHNLSVARIADPSASREETQSVLFTSTKTVATDTFRLLEVSVDSSAKVEDFPKTPQGSAMQGCKPFLVKAKRVAEIKIKGAKQFPITEYVALKHLDDKNVEFLTTDLESAQTHMVGRVDAEFPNYEVIFPQGAPQAEVLIDGVKLVNLLTVMSGLHPQIRIKFYGTEKPLALSCGNATQKARGLLMPIREN